jgi:hypothetical protein
MVECAPIIRCGPEVEDCPISNLHKQYRCGACAPTSGCRPGNEPEAGSACAPGIPALPTQIAAIQLEQAESIVFELICPLRTGRHRPADSRQARFDEAERMQRHGAARIAFGRARCEWLDQSPKDQSFVPKSVKHILTFDIFFASSWPVISLPTRDFDHDNDCSQRADFGDAAGGGAWGVALSAPVYRLSLFPS